MGLAILTETGFGLQIQGLLYPKKSKINPKLGFFFLRIESKGNKNSSFL
jgi:hypothetical protein